MPGLRFLGLLCALLAATTAQADDWPQWMGPARDNIWRESGLLESFPENGPRVLWRAPVAGGYAGPAVSNDRVYLVDFVLEKTTGDNGSNRKALPGTERVLCLDQGTGEVIWKHEYPVTYTINYPAGPRCTPLVHQGIVYTLGAEGHLHALDAATGDVVWQTDLKKKYQTTAPIWGYAAHPQIVEDKLITLAGGEGSQVIALNRQTGEEIWRALDSPEIGQGYSPPSLINFGGTRQLIIAKPDALSGLNPETGEVYWSEPYEADNGTIIMTPVLVDGHLYMGSFTRRNLLVKLTTDSPGAKTVWHDKARHGLSPINTQPLVDGNVLYGVDQTGRLTAVEIPSGDRLWETVQPISERPTNNGTAMLVRQGESDRYWLFTENGDLVIATLTPEGYDEIDRTHLIDPTSYAFGRDVVWCPPAYAGQCLFVRNGEECICVDLSAGQDVGQENE